MMTSLEKALITKLEELAYENEQLSRQNGHLRNVVEYAQGLCEEMIASKAKKTDAPDQCVYFNDISVTGILKDINKALGANDE